MHAGATDYRERLKPFDRVILCGENRAKMGRRGTSESDGVKPMSAAELADFRKHLVSIALPGAGHLPRGVVRLSPR